MISISFMDSPHTVSAIYLPPIQGRCELVSQKDGLNIADFSSDNVHENFLALRKQHSPNVVIGKSYGGIVGLYWALRSNCIRKLILIDVLMDRSQCPLWMRLVLGIRGIDRSTFASSLYRKRSAFFGRSQQELGVVTSRLSNAMQILPQPWPSCQVEIYTERFIPVPHNVCWQKLPSLVKQREIILSASRISVDQSD